MCIIAAKPAGIRMPTEETIENMWHRNHDGAGFMYATKGEVHIEKGFMTLDSFKKALERIGNDNDMTETAVVMHFRIATHGGVIPANTHPFPVTTSVGLLQKLVCNTKLGVAHNGIISGVTPRTGISDTMEYIAGQLGHLYKAIPEFYKNSDLMKMIDNAIGSKLAFLTDDGQVYTVGHFEEEDGILYSNTSYKAYDDFKLGKWDSFSKKWLYAYHDDFVDDPWYDSTYSFSKTVLVRMIGEHEGEYAINDKGMMIGADDCDMVVDTSGRVYRYTDDYTGIIYKDGWKAYRSDGSMLKAHVGCKGSLEYDGGDYDEYVFYEDVYVEDVDEELVQDPIITPMPTSSKKKSKRKNRKSFRK